MTYTKQTWADGAGGGTPISAARLAHIEDGIASASTTVNVKDLGATGDGTADDTTAVQAAINSLNSADGGIVWFPPGRYNIGTVTITGKNVTLDGPGVLYNGTVTVGTQTGYAPVNMYTRIGVSFDRGSKSTTVNAVHIANAHNVTVADLNCRNYRAVVHFPALSLGGTNAQHSARIRISGVTTPSWPEGTAGWPDYLVYISANTTGGTWAVGDLTVSDNPSASVRVGHVVGSGVDGLVCTGNTFFFPNYQEVNATKTSHVDISAAAGFILIADNQLFESGYESVKLNGSPANVAITGNHFAWSGQRDLKDAVAITTSPAADPRGVVSGNTFELYTKAAVAFYGTGNAAGVVVGPNAAMADNPNFSYYGATTLPSEFKRYTSATTLTGQPALSGGAGNHYTWTKQDTIGANTADSQQRLGPVSALASVDKFVSVTGAGTSIVQVSGVRGSASQFGGLVVMYVEDNAGANTATYLLNVVGRAAGKTVTVVNATGDTGGASATLPSFTWSIATTGHLQVTPVGSASGVFHFSATAIGNLLLNW